MMMGSDILTVFFYSYFGICRMQQPTNEQTTAKDLQHCKFYCFMFSLFIFFSLRAFTFQSYHIHINIHGVQSRIPLYYCCSSFGVYCCSVRLLFASTSFFSIISYKKYDLIIITNGIYVIC